MDYIEFKKAYQEIAKSIHSLNNKEYSTLDIKYDSDYIETTKIIIKGDELLLEVIDREIEAWDKTKKLSEFEKFLEEKNKEMRQYEDRIEKNKKSIEAAQEHIDKRNNEIEKEKEEDKKAKAKLEAYKGNVRKNAEKQYNDELSKLNTEYEALRQQKNAEKEEFRKKHGATYAELGGRKNLTKEEIVVFNRIKEEEKAIDKKYLGLLKGKHNEILKLKNDYEELKESFEKIDNNPEIEGKEIGLPEEKKAPEEQKPVKKRPAEEPAVEEPVVEEPVTEEPVVEEPVEDFITKIRKIIGDQESPETQPVAEEPTAEELTDDDMIDIDELFDTEEQEEEMPGFGSRDEEEIEHKDIASIFITRDNKYNILYEFTNKSGKRYQEVHDMGKMGLLKRIKERVKLILKRNEYGIDMQTVFRADPGVLRVLNDKELSEDYREKYLKALEGTEACPLEIKYQSTSNKYFRALYEGQQILRLNKGSDEGTRSLNERFGEGFDQHENPPIVDDRTADEPATGDHEQSVDEMDQDL